MRTIFVTAIIVFLGYAAAVSVGQAKPKPSEDAWIFVRGDGNDLQMSGNTDDVTVAKAEQRQPNEALLWVRHGSKVYVVRDAATLGRVRAIWKPVEVHGTRMEPIGHKLEAIGKRMESVGARMGAIGEQMGSVGQKMAGACGDGERERLQNDMEALQAKMEPLQREMESFNRTMQPYSTEMEKLGREMERLSANAEVAMRELINEVVARGL